MNCAPRSFGLRHREASAEVDLLGGELRRWRDHGQELLWDADARWWPRSSPVLFPIVGRLRGGQTSIDGQQRTIGIHGFASSQLFELRGARPDQLALGLRSNAETRAVYPFEFDLELRYRLHDQGLEVVLSLTNPGTRALPFALGLHPGLRWPFSAPSVGGHAIVFEHAESPQVPVITARGLLAPNRRMVSMPDRRLALEAALLEHDALCFLDARSPSLRFESPDGAAIVVSAHNFAHWALWTKPGAPFLCIEAWTGHPDADDFAGDFAAKPSMRVLAPGASSTHCVNLRFTPAPPA